MGDCDVYKVRNNNNGSLLIVVFYCLWIMLLLPSYTVSTTWKNYQQQSTKYQHHPQSLVSASSTNNNQNQGISVCNMSECDCKPIYTNWYTIRCNFTDKQIVHFIPGSFPNETQVIEIIGGKEIELTSKLFYNVRDLQKIQFYRVLSLKLRKHSFANLTTVQLFIDIVECVQVLIESGTFDKIHGTLSGTIYNCNHVMIQSKAFSYLLHMNITNVPRLELFDSAFNFDYPVTRLSRHGAESVIHLENVKIGELPNRVFSTVLAEIQIHNSQINTIRKNAFTANEIIKLTFANTTIETIETSAFHFGIFFHEVEIHNTMIQKIESAAISTAINNFTVHLSKIKEIEINGINITSSTVTITNSTFVYIGHHALTFKDTNYVNIEWNLFWVLANNSFNFVMTPAESSYFHFVSNEIFNVTASSLKFISTVYEYNDIIDHVYINFIKFPIQECGCSTDKWLQDIFGISNDEDEIVMYQELSYCLINQLLSSCYNVTQGLLNMKNFSDLICVNNTNKIECPKMKQTIGAKSVIETINKELITRLQQSGDFNIDNNNKSDNSYLYLILALSLVFLIIVFGAFVLLLVKGGLWLKRKGYCVQFNRFQYNSPTTHHINDSATETEDMINNTNITQITTDQTMTENKLNENLPGELTHELLQALREKLNDPNSYHEAREMIERLYDHFLVEDPYNNTEEVDQDGANLHLYEELNARGNGGPLTPTRTATLPISENNNSPPADATTHSFLRIMEERLNEPSTSNNSRTVLISEYAEPLDVAETPKEVSHVYSELPIQSVRIKETETSKMALRPLPKKPNRYGEGTSSSSATPTSNSYNRRQH